LEPDEFALGTEEVSDALVIDVEMMSKVIVHAQHLDLNQRILLLTQLQEAVCRFLDHKIITIVNCIYFSFFTRSKA